jgi:Holliday junction resolvase RusA-like endonuclease
MSGHDGEVGATTLFIRQRMPGGNDLLKWAKTNPRWYASEKRKWGTLVALYAREQGFKVISSPAHFEFELWEPNRRRDPDNMCFGASKFLLDALQDAKLLENDNWNWVRSFAFTWKQAAPAGVKLTVNV